MEAITTEKQVITISKWAISQVYFRFGGRSNSGIDRYQKIAKDPVKLLLEKNCCEYVAIHPDKEEIRPHDLCGRDHANPQGLPVLRVFRDGKAGLQLN